MTIFVPGPTSRRTFLVGTTGLLAAATLSTTAAEDSKPVREVKLTAAAGRVALVGKPHPATDVWCYDGRVPGPEIRLRQGEPVRIIVQNNLEEETTVHWHGIRLPIGMDGVPGISQPPIKPGETFAYEFTPPDAGTYWYHPHMDSLQQIGRGLSGALIVEEHAPPAVNRDLVWMLADWRLNEDGRILGGFGNTMEAMMAGRVGNVVTVNGRLSAGEPVRAGERIRLRLVNGALARIMALRFEGHRPLVVAMDGQPCDPHEPEDGRILLGPAMRTDLLIDMEGKLGARYRVVDDFYTGLGYVLTELAYDAASPLRAQPLDAARSLPPNPLPEPDLA